jgi:hypothetical protein
VVAPLQAREGRLTAAAEVLNNLLGPVERPSEHDFTGAKAELIALFARRSAARDRRAATKQTIPAAEPEPPSAPSSSSSAPSVALVAELMPEGAMPPAASARVDYIDHAVIDEPSPLRSASMNNIDSRPTPAAPLPNSPTTQLYFAAPGGTGSRRFDVPRNF